MGNGFQAQKYPDSQNLFSLGKGAIYPAGSWDISTFRGQAKFPMGAFPPPLPAGAKDCYISDHTDIAWASTRPPRTRTTRRSSWIGWRRRNSRTLYANALPGFFPLSNEPVRSTTISPRRWSAGARAASRRSATPTRSCRAARQPRERTLERLGAGHQRRDDAGRGRQADCRTASTSGTSPRSDASRRGE